MILEDILKQRLYVPKTVRAKPKSCFGDLRTKSIEDLRTKRGLNEDPFRAFEVVIFIKMLKGHKESHIYNITDFVTKAHMFIMV